MFGERQWASTVDMRDYLPCFAGKGILPQCRDVWAIRIHVASDMTGRPDGIRLHALLRIGSGGVYYLQWL